MSEQTLQAEPVSGSEPPPGAPAQDAWSLREFVRQYPWWFVAAALVFVSAVLVLWARTRPGYDPYGWLVWGYQTLHLNLDLGGAPSWKPLPYLFTVPFAAAGHYELWLWMVTSVSISLSGSIFAGRIAYKLTAPTPERRFAGFAAAAFAGLALLGIEDYGHYILSVQSDPMIVTFCLAAIDMHLSGHQRWAFALGVLTSLGRPEAWPFLGLYSIWLWRTIPSMRKLILGGLAVIPAMWFGIPVLAGNDPLVAGKLALGSPRALHESKVLGTLHRFTELQYLPVQLAALFAIGFAGLRRNLLVLILAVGSAVWVVIEVGFALHGWPALPRYVMEPAAVMTVLAGVAVGWALLEVPRIGRGVPQWAAIPVVVLLVASLAPAALSRARTERKDLTHERARTTELNRLQTTLRRVGGYQHVRNCGEPVTNVEWVSALAWFMKLDVGYVGHRPDFELHQRYPIVMFVPLAHGWHVYIHHTLPTKLGRCRGLNRTFSFR